MKTHCTNLLLSTAAVSALAVGGAASAQVLWNNGEMVTHPGQGSGGLDVSMSGAAPCNTAGSNARQIAPDPHFRIADDFTVTGAWTVNSIVVYGYETGQQNPTWTGANLEIWDGRPGDAGSNIIAAFSNPVVAQTNIWRTFNGTTINTDRRINSITFDTGSLSLSGGDYWISWQVVGGVSGWAPPAMEPNPGQPNAPVTVAGNGRQLAATGWQNLMADCEPSGVETPFLIIGTPGSSNCPADINGDGVVDVSDLLALLGAWGPNPGHPADINGDNVVDVSDLLALLGAWGPCPGPPTPTGACCFSDGSCTPDLTEVECDNISGNYNGNFSSCATCPQPPNGSTCSLALEVNIGSQVQVNTTGNAVGDGPLCGGVQANQPTSWVKVTATADQMLTAYACTLSAEARIAVYCNECTALTCLGGGSQNNDMSICGNPFDGQASWCASAGNTYYIAVWRHSGGPGDITVAVTAGGSCTPTVDCGHLEDPVCTLPTANCQPRSGGTYTTSDTTAAFKVADNFHAAATGNVTSLCWQGVELLFAGGFGVCPNNLGQGNPFRITYYADAGGLPGAQIAQFTGNPTYSRIDFINFAFGPAGLIDYTMTHAPVPVTQGECYWVEVVQVSGGGCYFLWSPSDQGDKIAYQSPDGQPYTFADQMTGHASGNYDRSFCVSIATADPNDCETTVEGACCVGGSCTQETGDDCAAMGGCFSLGESCSSVNCISGVDYFYDCGATDNSVGWTNGGVFGWMHRFDVDGGGNDTITQIHTAYGNVGGANIGVTPGQQVGVGVYADTGSGPGALLFTMNTTAAGSAIGTDVPQVINITPTAVSGSFYVAVWVEHAAGTFPSPLAGNATNNVGDAWFFGAVEGTFGTFDPAAPTTAPADLNVAGFPGSWMLRANGN